MLVADWTHRAMTWKKNGAFPVRYLVVSQWTHHGELMVVFWHSVFNTSSFFFTAPHRSQGISRGRHVQLWSLPRGRVEKGDSSVTKGSRDFQELLRMEIEGNGVFLRRASERCFRWPASGGDPANLERQHGARTAVVFTITIKCGEKGSAIYSWMSEAYFSYAEKKNKKTQRIKSEVSKPRTLEASNPIQFTSTWAIGQEKPFICVGHVPCAAMTSCGLESQRTQSVTLYISLFYFLFFLYFVLCRRQFIIWPALL